MIKVTDDGSRELAETIGDREFNAFNALHCREPCRRIRQLA
jgi:hypothetical protein